MRHLGHRCRIRKGCKHDVWMLNSLTKKLPLLGVEFKNEARFNKVPVTPNKILKQDVISIHNDKHYDANLNWLQRSIGLCNYVAQKYRFDIAYYTNIIIQHQFILLMRSLVRQKGF